MVELINSYLEGSTYAIATYDSTGTGNGLVKVRNCELVGAIRESPDTPIRYYKNSGTATFSSDGTTTQFSIAHGLVSTPSKVLVTPMSADAAGDFWIDVDDTYIYVNYKTAPPSGTDNIVLGWEAEV